MIGASLEESCEAWGFPREFWEHDYHVAITSLPAILGVTLQSLPAPVPYLSPGTEAIERWRPALEAIPGLKVGTFWQGNPEHGNDARRSLDLAEFAPLASVPGVSLISLQKNHGVKQLREAGFPIVELGADYLAGDWHETGGVIAGLDLVIGPDSALGHLSSAMGKPVWLALETPCDCRWLCGREDSPWYPTLRLWRPESARGVGAGFQADGRGPAQPAGL